MLTSILLALAIAPTAAPQPVRISRCHMNYATGGGAFVVSGVPAALHIAFTNAGSQAATRIGFRVTLAGRTETIEDTGVFSPNARIEHVFNAFHTVRVGMSLPQPVCSVTSVTFADGTQWSAPQTKP